MNKTNLFRAAFFFMMVSITSCKREKPVKCQTCIATYNGSQISSQSTCSAEEEEDFRSTHYYATVVCQP